MMPIIIFAWSYNGVYYYYIKNQQGDILGFTDSNGNVIVTYTYDAWGKLLSSTGSWYLAQYNGLRYRGYYYDVETGLYYCQSRYYDPEVGRFLNADDTDYLDVSGTTLGCNLYAYCENDGVNNADPDGRVFLTIAVVGGAALLKMLIAFAALCITTIILLDPGFQRALYDAINALGTGIKNLVDTVVEAIDTAFDKAKTKSKSKKYELHHIVAKVSSAWGAFNARKLLAHKNVKIGINSSYNLVSINYNLHRHLHTNAYYNAVYYLLKRGEGSRKKTELILNVIKSALIAVSNKL